MIPEIIAFLKSTKYEDIPAELLAVSDAVIPDNIACMLRGSREASAQPMYRMLAEAPEGTHRVPFASKEVPVEEAALALGYFGHALDFDNSSNLIGHTSSILAATLTTLAESSDFSGRDAVLAWHLAMEVSFKIAEQAVPKLNFRGWHITPVFGTIGACVLAGQLMRLDEETFSHALSLAVSHCSGMMVQFGSHAKFYHCGMAAANGIRACRMASYGVRGNLNAFEGENGFYQAFCGVKPHALGLGSPWSLTKYSLLIKLFPCCSAAHAAICGAMDFRKSHPEANVESVLVEVPEYSLHNLIHPNPRTSDEARFSMQYAVGNALVNGAFGFAAFTPDGLADQSVRRMGEKVEMRVTSDYPAFVEEEPCRLTICHDGETWTRAIPYGRGRTLDSPASEEELLGKFLDCVSDFLTREEAETLFRRLRGLRDEKDLSCLRFAL